MSVLGLIGGAARRIAEVPALRDFAKNVDAILSVEDPEVFWECEPHFQKLLGTTFLTETVNHELSLMVDDGSYLVAGASTDANFTIASTSTWALSVRLLRDRPSTPRLLSSAEHMMLGVPRYERAIAITLTDYDASNARQPKKLVSRGRVTVPPGAILRRRAGVDVSRFLFTGSPVVAVVMCSRLIVPLRYEYDVDTLEHRRTVAGAIRSSRMEFATKLLAQIGDESSLPQLSALARHEDHFVRWAAIRATAAIDPARGLRALRDALSDPHPQIVSAALTAIPRVAGIVNADLPKAETAN
jgi:HEAT repeat protein